LKKGREGERSALETNKVTYRICSGWRWAREGNLPLLDLQSRALVMLPFGVSQARDALMQRAQKAQTTSRDAKGWVGCDSKSSVSSESAHATTLSASCLLTVLQLTPSISGENILWLMEQFCQPTCLTADTPAQLQPERFPAHAPVRGEQSWWLITMKVVGRKPSIN